MRPEDETFATVLEEGLGWTICRHFYFPYAVKLWGAPPQELSPIQARKRVSASGFVKLVRKMSSFRGRSSFSTWLYRIVVNTALDFRRKSAATRFHCEDYAENRLHHNPTSSPRGNPVDGTGIYAALDKLPEKQKTAILLVFGEGLSHREASQVLGCPEVSVSWRIHQARKKLRDYMERS